MQQHQSATKIAGHKVSEIILCQNIIKYSSTS